MCALVYAATLRNSLPVGLLGGAAPTPRSAAPADLGPSTAANPSVSGIRPPSDLVPRSLANCAAPLPFPTAARQGTRSKGALFWSRNAGHPGSIQTTSTSNAHTSITVAVERLAINLRLPIATAVIIALLAIITTGVPDRADDPRALGVAAKADCRWPRAPLALSTGAAIAPGCR